MASGEFLRSTKTEHHEEENRPWWGGRASNPVKGATRFWVGSTPILFRH